MGKRGPRTAYKPDNCTIAYKFCLLGATNEDLAGLFEVAPVHRRQLARADIPHSRRPCRRAATSPTPMSPSPCCTRPRASTTRREDPA